MRQFRAQGSGLGDRREFLALCGCAAAGLALSGCASVTARPVRPIDGRLSLRLADYRELDQRDGAAVVQPEGMSDPIYVLRVGDRQYAALSPICTHRGCTVELAGSGLECPCHGSMYDREGKVVRGPAQRALTRFPATVQGDRLVIELPRSS